ncbi:MAG: hypothetical protein H3C31_02990 [Brumimicrobium sp.]|nr:hypothetical protein [Brumimicrobium sp.]
MFKYTLVIIATIFTGIVVGQMNTSSPYSSWGIGDVGFYGDAYANSLGGASVALTDSSEANFFNPSTYSLLAKQLPLFSFGLNHYEKSFSDNNGLASEGRFTNITHLGLAIPFANRFGLGFGLKPYSRMGYEIGGGNIPDGDSIHYRYSGKGGIQEIFIGFAGNILDNRNHSLSLGVNGIYYFGKINNQRRAYQNTSNGEKGGLDDRKLIAKDFGMEIGLNYEYKISDKHSLRLGAVFRPERKMKFEKEDTRIFYSNFTNIGTYDTILNNPTITGRIHIPAMTKIGIAYRYTPQDDSVRSRTKLSSYLFTFEYDMMNWSAYQENFNGTGEINRYVNSSSYRFGFEFVPHRLSAARSSYIKYFDKIKYRIGGYWIDSPYAVGGTQLQDRGVTLGFGFPLILNRAVSTISFSANYGVMGSSKIANSIKENYYGFNIGINIAPGYDRWFKKYKYD